MIFLQAAYVLLWFAPAVAMLWASKQLIQFVQLASYQAGGYLRVLKRLPKKCILPGAVLSVSAMILLLLGSLLMQLPALFVLLASFIVAGLIQAAGYAIGFAAYREKRVKVSLKITARVKRLYAALWLVGVLVSLGMYYLSPQLGWSALVPLLAPALLLAAMLITWPLEKTIQLMYRQDARNILNLRRKEGLQVIGITGSYGKTTVKNLLAAFLAQKAPTLASPASFNTPLGLSRCIREELGPEHHFFIAEMGARHPQDIRVLSRMIKPRYGILTAIGPQHLETMGTVEKVKQTKYALIAGLPRDGYALFNDDGGILHSCFEKTHHVHKAITGTPGSAAWAEDATLQPEGAAFALCLPSGERVPCKTRLSGEHNIRNILLAAAMAVHLGVSPHQIARALESIRPPASRLEVSTHSKGYQVINNGFNSNPDSSRRALEVLAVHSVN